MGKRRGNERQRMHMGVKEEKEERRKRRGGRGELWAGLWECLFM